MRLNEFCGLFIDKPAKYCNVIDQITFNTLKLKKDDVLICRTNGNPKLVGKAALVPKDYEYAYASYLFKVRPDDKYINSATLVAFLNSKFGRKEIERFSMVGNQANFSPAKFREINIPILPENIQSKIEEVLYKAFSLLEKANALYDKGEKYLKLKLNILTETNGNVVTNIKSLKESLETSGRLDAEFYQPKFDKLSDYLSKNKTEKLGKLVYIQKSIEPGSEEYRKDGIPFIRVADLSKFGLSKGEIKLDKNSYSDVIKPRKDTILLSKDGSVAIAYKVTEDLDVITSSAILHLTIKDKSILPDYLTLILNSDIVKLQAERDAGGSILQHWKPSEIKNVEIPILPKDEQEYLADIISESFKLREESYRLQNQAVNIVEDELAKE